VGEPGHDGEDRGHRREGELKSRVVDGVRVPGEQGDRCEQQGLPRVAQPSGKPRERGERACDPRPDHRRLRTDRKDIRQDPSKRAELADPATYPEQPGKRERTRRDQDHMLPAYCK
jgi:hypothetical protein